MKKLVTALCATAALAVPSAPALADEPSPIVELRQCPEGYVGRSVWVADRGLLWNCYRLP